MDKEDQDRLKQLRRKLLKMWKDEEFGIDDIWPVIADWYGDICLDRCLELV